MTNPTPKTEVVRFTTLISPPILSNIKLVSYFTNRKLYEVINDSLVDYIKKFEIDNNTSITTLINFQHKFSNTDDIDVKDIEVIDDKDKVKNTK